MYRGLATNTLENVTYPTYDRRRVLQISNSQSNVKAFVDEVDEPIDQRKFHPHVGVDIKERGEDRRHMALAKHKWGGHSEQAADRLRFAGRVGNRVVNVVEESL